MTRATEYDLAVIGAGSAGLVAASFAKRLGASVVLIEADRIGGDCTWTGCIPSKALLHVARVAHTVRNASRFGLRISPPEVDPDGVMAYVRRAIERVFDFETPERLRDMGLEVIQASARFVDPETVEVEGRRITAKHFVICTGAEPVVPSISGLNEIAYLTYESVFSLDELPRRLLVLGGGPVGVELAQALARLGSAVVVVEAADRILDVAEPEASDVLTEVFLQEGIDVHMQSSLKSVARTENAITVQLPEERIEVDAVLVAVGRKPRLADLGLEQARVDLDRNGIRVDQNLRTSQKHIYAAGDVVGSFQFTHYAAWQGYVAARNALLPGRARGTLPTVPWTVFTDPAIAHAGLSETEAREKGWKVEIQRLPMERIDRAQTEDQLEGFIKLIARDGKLVGATVVASVAGEVINLLAFAIQHRRSVNELAKTILTYPTYGFGTVQVASEATIGDLMRGVRGRLMRALAD